MSKEIERKFLFKSFPKGLKITHSYNQFYLISSPDIEVRFRKKTDMQTLHEEYKITIKSSGGLIRDEFEYKISEKEYEKALEDLYNTNLNFIMHKLPISKASTSVILDDKYKLVISLVDASDFVYGEIEFNSEKEALNFDYTKYDILKDCIDITYDVNYKMKNYWNKTRLGINTPTDNIISNWADWKKEVYEKEFKIDFSKLKMIKMNY